MIIIILDGPMVSSLSTISEFLILIFEINCFIFLKGFDLYLSVEYIGYDSIGDK